MISLPIAAALIGAYIVTMRQTQVAPQFSITVNATLVLGTASPLLIGSNVQWSSGGHVLINMQHPEYGVRRDVIGLTTALGVSLLRFPGGRTSETYHWRNGVGPMGQRQMIDTGWSPQFPYFGTDEFRAFCKAVNCGNKLITVNYCTGSAQEAANWVEYCNAPAPQTYDRNWTVSSYAGNVKAPAGYFAWLRQKFGHSRPFGVKYWEVGNEVYCREDIAPNVTPEKYGADFVKFAQAMKAVDATIEVGAVAVDVDPWTDWNEPVLKVAAGSIDYMAPHYGSSLCTLTWDVYCTPATTSRRVYFPTTETYTFTATMRADIITEGGPADQVGVPAKMRFSIDGQPLCIWDVVHLLQKFEYTCRVTQGYHDLAVTFINDYCNDVGNDRNAFLYGVTRRSASLPEENIWYPDDAEQQLLFNDGKTIPQRIARLRSLIGQYSPHRGIPIVITEGCMVYDEGATAMGYPKEEIRHDLRFKAALWQAAYMNGLIRGQTPAFCHWLLFDGGDHGIIREPNCTADGLPLVTPAYYAIQLYSRLGGSKLLETSVVSPTYIWPDEIHPPPVREGNWYGRSCPRPDHVPYMDAVALLSPGGRYLNIMVTNRSNVSATTRIQVNGLRPQPVADVRTLCVWAIVPRPDRIVGNKCAELEAYCETKTQGNEVTQPDVVGIQWTRINKVTPAFTYTFRPFSITLITLRQRY